MSALLVSGQESGRVIIQHDKDIDESQFLARSFCQAVHMFIPWFKDTPVSRIKFPQLYHNTKYTFSGKPE